MVRDPKTESFLDSVLDVMVAGRHSGNTAWVHRGWGVRSTAPFIFFNTLVSGEKNITPDRTRTFAVVVTKLEIHHRDHYTKRCHACVSELNNFYGDPRDACRVAYLGGQMSNFIRIIKTA